MFLSGVISLNSTLRSELFSLPPRFSRRGCGWSFAGPSIHHFPGRRNNSCCLLEVGGACHNFVYDGPQLYLCRYRNGSFRPSKNISVSSNSVELGVVSFIKNPAAVTGSEEQESKSCYILF